MRRHHEFKPEFVQKIAQVIHKGKARDFFTTEQIHGGNTHELIFVDYGAIDLHLNDERIQVKTGECILIKGGDKHAFGGLDGGPFDYLNIMFWGKIPDSTFSKPYKINRKLFALMERMKYESELEMPYCCDVIICCLTELIINFIREDNPNLEHSTDVLLGKESRYYSSIVDRAMGVIEEKYSSSLNLQKLSKAVTISSSHLAKLLKRETGDNFSTLLHKKRVEVAKELLRESPLSLSEISKAVGYSSLSFFFKIFKRITGMTPKSYETSMGAPTEYQSGHLKKTSS